MVQLADNGARIDIVRPGAAKKKEVSRMADKKKEAKKEVKKEKKETPKK